MMRFYNMFLDYKKESKDLVLDLINRDNPQLEYPLDHDNCILGKPVVLSSANMVEFRNTSIIVIYKGEPAEKYVGPVTLYYRRLTGPQLFPGGRVIFDQYRESTSNIPKEEFIGYINDRYGLELRTGDISTSNISNGLGTGSIGFSSECLAFVGNISYRRIQPLLPLDDFIPETINDWLLSQTVGSLDYTAVLYGVDFTPFDHLIKGAGNTFQNSKYSRPLMDVLSSYANIDFGPDSDRPMNANTIRATIHKLPSTSTALSLANLKYSNVMLITPANANSWLKGSVYLHYDEDTL